ncbi:VPLPA-CTERM sorting domain-containing protein [Palleronia sp. KMU-117]|uniref:VPLPA-CTERM sorting domain-containing protein n=1 Tax=Palleronia sp. KMU-117 TaxID=3434108 RepID=UPI003D72FFC2
MSMFRVLVAAAAVGVGVQGAAASTFGLDDYKFVILEAFDDPGSAGSSPTINNDGTVLYYDRNRLPFTAVPEYVTVNIGGAETSRINPTNGRLFLRGGVINDSGQIVAEIIDDNLAIADRSLVLIDPDGTVTELMRISPTGGDPRATVRLLNQFRVNGSGEVAFSGISLSDGGGEVVGKVAPGVSPIILDQDIPGVDGRNVTSEVDITDDGVVTWFVQNQGELGKLLASDGQSTPWIVLSTGDPQLQLLPEHATNDTGQVVGWTSRFGPTVILGSGFDQPGYDPQGFSDVQALAGSFFPFVQGLDINDFGQILVRNGDDGSIYLDGERLIGAGDMLGIGELIPLLSGDPTQIVTGASLNNLGQVVFEARSSVRGTAPGTIEKTETIVVRIDPRGATPDHAVLPTSVSGGVNAISLNLVNDLGITAPIYVDPVLASGFLYQLSTGMPNFLSLIIPDQDLGGDTLFDVMFDDIVVSLGFDETLDFTSYLAEGVSSFKILGIAPEAGRTTDDPFVVGLTFASRGRVDFSITGLTDDPGGPTPIPLPAGGYFLLGGLLGLAVLRRRRAIPGGSA